MNISEPFIRRPVATTLLTVAVALAGGVAYFLLPVSPLPEVDFPTISVNASLPGASPETMASSVATPLERQFGHIAGVTEMTSSSGVGSTSITLQFDLDRNIDGAGRDVQAAINAARANLPSNLPSNPTYRKVNPADAPIFMIALTSSTLDKGNIYDIASTVMAQKLSQVGGVGQVVVGGSALPSVRVELNPNAVHKYGLGFEQVRTALASANANIPKGLFATGNETWEIGASDQIFKAADYQSLIVAYHNGAALRISDIGGAIDSVEDLRNAGYVNGKPAILVIVFRQPGANIIGTVDRLRAILPQLHASLPQAIDMQVAMDQTVTIRASVRDVERTLIIFVLLVLLVVFAFLRSPRVTLIPSVAVPVSLIGTFGAMYLLDYRLDNLSLMALTISTGFVVDDAIVVIENITRHMELGMKPYEAALKGASGVGFTVLAMSTSLVAVFIPLLLMGGIVGRLFREFSATLSVAIAISMLVSLTTTPMMCAYLLQEQRSHGWLYNATERCFNRIIDAYGAALRLIPKGFFPQQDTGRLNGSVQADQDTSFEQMDRIVKQFVDTLNAVLGRSWRASRAAIDRHRSQHHRHDRNHPADRHREEKCDPDDRFRNLGRTQRRQKLSRRDLRSKHVAFPANPDDHDGGVAGSASAGAGDRNRIGAAAAAGDSNHRRARFQPDVDVVHRSCGLSVF
jgi:multidrug efflux pump